MAWLYKRSGSAKWWIGYRVNGRQVLCSTGTSNLIAAERELEKIQTIVSAQRGYVSEASEQMNATTANCSNDWLAGARAGMLKIPVESFLATYVWKAPPRTPGIYFLILRGVIVYIGQSKDVHQRIIQHRDSPEKDFDEAVILPTPETQLDKIEKYCIGMLHPPQNKTRWNKPVVFMKTGRRLLNAWLEHYVTKPDETAITPKVT